MPDDIAMTPMQQAVLAIRAQRARIAELEQAATAPIAIIGMACRYPADATSPAALWDAVRQGRDGSCEVPADRWDIDAYYDPKPGQPGKMYVRRSCFIDGVDQFEPLFFRISPREAVGIDPQQRLLLEATWEALEDAAIPPPALVGSQTGVFVGISTNDYSALLSRTAHGSGSNATAGAGNAASVASGRLSYTFGFQGPCMAVDTACSSSLVATHLAVQALRAGECSLAVVAGVNLMLTPDITVNFCQGRMLSPDGHCKTFDAAADGYVRGEGCGVLIFKRLADAVADGDRVLAVVRGSALNQDGRSAGLTAPNGLAQEAVIRKALANAGLDLDDIDYVEAHGTGTALGDPIEMHALKSVFAGRDRPLYVGSVKTNIGHTEAAAGVAGLIKAVQMLRHQELPPTLHFHQMNPHIELGAVDIRVPTECAVAPLRAIGVSSFGFSGTNAHIVLERAPAQAAMVTAQTRGSPQRDGDMPLLFLSARSEPALRALIARYRDYLGATEDAFADICHTAAIGRARFPWWVAVRSPAELATAQPSNATPPALPPSHGRKVALPGAVFQRERFWIDAPVEAVVQPEIDPGLPPLLGRRLSLPFASESRWEAAISPHHPALGFLSEHTVGGTPILPAACFIEMALAARPGFALVELRIPAPLPITEDLPRLVQTVLAGDDSFRIVSCTADGGDAVLHATGRFRASPAAGHPPTSAEAGTPVPAEALYEAMARRGVSHGPAFRLLSEIRRAPGRASAALGAAPAESRFVLHPARLDAAFQLVAAALPNLSDDGFVPSRIGRLVLHRRPGAEARVQAFARREAAGVLADIIISDAEGVAVEVSDLLFSPTAATGAGSGFYRIDWRPQPLIADLAPPDFLPEPETLAAILGDASAAFGAEFGAAAYTLTAQGLEDAATAYVVRALRQLGLPLEAGADFTFGATAEALGIEERHHRLFRRMLGMLAADGILIRHGRRWRARGTVTERDPEALLDDLGAVAPAMAGEIAVLRRCGAALAAVLTGRQNPLALLFPAEGDGAGAFYEGSPYARTVNALLGRAAATIAAAQPLGRILRVLEVGGGTGGATGALLGAIPAERRHYVFTDVSQSFLAAAPQKFMGERLHTRLLDIEQPAGPQDFAPESFDVILAANVLHATADIARSLGHLRGLLAPGGILLLVESTAARRWVDIIFGLTEGWWRFTDTDRRPDHPLLTPDRWTAALSAAGFETATHGSEVIVARRAPAATAAGPESLVHVVPPADATEDGQVALMASLTRLAVEAARRARPPRLVLVAESGLGHAGLPGFLRTVAIEAPSLRPKLLIAPPSAAAVQDEVLADTNEPEICWAEDGARLAPRLAPAALPVVADVTGAWLITGASGGVAQTIAGWLAQHGARTIILLSRSNVDTARLLTEAQGQGLRLLAHAGDAADAALVTRLLHDHAVEGVVHAAGLLADAALAEQDEASLRSVAHAKIGGALALDAATRAHPVKHFILCASAAGIVGSARQVNHAFCSTFLDGLAAARRQDGLPAISLDWGVWSGTGSAAALGFDQRADQLGLGSMTPAQGAALFGQALSATQSQLVVLPSVNWPRFTAHFGAALPGLFRDLAIEPVAAPSVAAATPQAATTPSARAPDRQAALTRVVAACLGLTGAIDPDTPLHDLGLDSLVAVEIRNRAERELGLTVSVRDLIEGASIRSLLGSAPEPVPPAAEPDRTDALGAIVAACLGISGTVDIDTPLHDLGLDSLVAVEIRNRAERELGLAVSVRDLIEGATIRSLLSTEAKPTETTGTDQPPSGEMVPDLAHRADPFPLTDMQMAYYLGRRSDVALGNVACYLYTEFDTDQLDLERAEAAFNRLIARHDMLRLMIRSDGTQQILPDVPYYRFETRDLRGQNAEESLSELRQMLPRRNVPPDSWPLFDIRVTRFGTLARLHMGFDLIALDAASIHALRREWGLLYDQPDVVLPPIRVSFRDAVLAMNAARGGPAWKRSEAYWLARVASLPAGPDLPQMASPADNSPRQFRRRGVVIDAETAAALRRQAQAHGLTLPMLLAAAYADTLAGWSRRQHFCVTVTSFNRPDLHPDMGLVLGDYTSTILLEVDARHPTFLARARALADQLAADLEHSEIGGIEVMRQIARQTGAPAPAVPVVFTSALGFTRPGARGADAGSAGWDRLGRTVYNVSSTPQVLIDQQVSEEDGQLFCNWDVAWEMFPPGVIDAVVASYDRLLHGLATGAMWDAARTALVPTLLRAEQPRAATPDLLQAGLERHARTAPDRIALIAPDRQLDYRTLDAAAAHLAAALRPGLGTDARDRLVAVILPKGWRQIVAVLAVLKAGAAYLPIDPALPAERRQLLIARGEAIVLDDAEVVDTALAQAEAGVPLPALPPVTDTSRLAYVIYTSGSTGEPKGVMIEHQAAWATIAEINRRWSINADDRIFGLSSLSFDLSVYDIFGPLAVGATLVLPEAEATRDPSHWAALLTQHHVTIWNSVPALMAMQAEYRLPENHALRLVLLSGDWVPLDLVAQLRAQAPAAALIALGGATEAAIWSNAHEIGALDPTWASIPYGTPLAGQMLHVVNGQGAPCPDWVTGEIEISGAGLARGYWRDPVQTAARFRRNAVTGERYYRTGDLGRFRPYGDAEGPMPIEFLGREDFQVKVQGHRIELGEVEAALASHPAVLQAVATAPAGPGRGLDRVLHAFIVPRAAPTTTPDTAWEDLQAIADAAFARQAQPIDRDSFDLNAATLTELTAAAAAAAFQTITGSYELPDSETLIRDHGIAPRYRLWLERVLPAVAQVGMGARPASSHSISEADHLGFSRASLDLLDRVIVNLPDILTEHAHSATIYLDDETPKVYGRMFATPNAVLGAVLAALAAGRPLSVLDVGAGLGTTLAAVEGQLPTDRVTWHFTDVSPHFLRAGKANFADRPWLSFATFDIDKPPGAQHRGRYDVILASNTLHVAADVAATLGHLRACLAPGGVLLALEQTRFHPWFDLSMGLQSGFDARTDLDRRPAHPLLSRTGWERALAETGFAAVATVTAPGSLEDLMGFDVIMARADTGARTDGALEEELRTHVRARLPAYMVPASVTFIDRVPLSANGKVDRRALIPAPAAPSSRTSQTASDRLMQQIGAVVAEVMQLAHVDPHRSLFELGATSLTLVSLQRLLGERLGRVIPLQRIFETPTVAGFVAAITTAQATSSALVTFDRLDDDRPKLILMPGIFSLPFYLRELAAALAKDVVVVSVQLPGMADGETPLDSVAAQAAYVVAHIRKAGLKAPYLIGGHSFGGLVAIEAARSLRDAGEAVPLLLLGDTVRTYNDFAAFQTDDLAHTAMARGLHALYGGRIQLPQETLDALPPHERFAAVARAAQEQGLLGALDLPLERMVRTFKANFKAIGTFNPAPIPGEMVLLRTEGGYPEEFLDYETGDALTDPAFGWGEVVPGGITIRTMPGDHLSMLDPAHLTTMAAIIGGLVRDALATSGRDKP
jgi:pyochelin synthetase